MINLTRRIVHSLVLFVGIVSVVCVSLQAHGGEGWHRAESAAFEVAQRQGLPVVVLLRVEAHGNPDLKQQVMRATQNLERTPIGLELVYPEEAYAKPGVARDFVNWADRVGATSLPALAWVGADGRPYGMIELTPGEAAEPLERRLEALSVRYDACRAAYDRAAQLNGADRAQSLHEGLQLIDASCRSAYHDVMQQIVSLDADNVLGLKAVYQPVLTEVVINTAVQEQVYPMIDAGAFAQAREVIDDLLTNQPVSVEQRQLLMAFQAQLLHSQDRTQEAIALIDQAIGIGSDSPTKDQLVMARLQFMSD